MDNMTYRFEVGDIVRPAIRNRFKSYYRTKDYYEVLCHDSDYRVMAITRAAGGYQKLDLKVAVRGPGHRPNQDGGTTFFDSRNFTLVRKRDDIDGQGKKFKNWVKWIIIDQDRRVVWTGTELSTVGPDEKVEELLRENGAGRYHVFQYVKTGALSNTPVVWDSMDGYT